MSSKSQLNKMSKREILNSIMQQQYQDSATTHRLLISLARASGIKPEDLARHFVGQDANRDFASQLNTAIDAAFAAEQAKAGEAAAKVPASAEVTDEAPLTE
jgi:hypothetical protein